VVETYDSVGTESPDTRPGPGVRFVGMRAYTTDTERMWIWKSAGWVLLDEPWQSFTPVATGITLGTGGNIASRYQRSYRRCRWKGVLTFGAGGAVASANPSVTIPVPGVDVTVGASMINAGEGVARFHRSGTSFFVANARVNATSLTWNATQADGTFVSPTSPWTWGNADQISWQVEYEIA
jgi:hypothetical protein